MLFCTKNESLQLFVFVGQGPRTAAYAYCIINEHTERNNNGHAALHSASVSLAGVRGHVWLCVCAWLSRTETNKETFESGEGSTYVEREKKKAAGCITGERGHSVSAEFWLISLINSPNNISFPVCDAN